MLALLPSRWGQRGHVGPALLCVRIGLVLRCPSRSAHVADGDDGFYNAGRPRDMPAAWS